MQIKAITNWFRPIRLRKINNCPEQPLTKKDEIARARRIRILNYYRNRVEMNFPKLSKDQVCTMGELCNEKFSNLLARYGDNLAQIEEMFGKYGLAAYVQSSPEIFMKERNINVTEGSYSLDKTVQEAFLEYISYNRTGLMSDLFTRFGKAGEILFGLNELSEVVAIYKNAYHFPTSAIRPTSGLRGTEANAIDALNAILPNQ